VLTGATSGIGLVTAREMAKRGAKLMLTARNGDALRALVNELKVDGCEARWKQADVASEKDLHAVADKAIENFGRIDTWINNAGVSIYGKLEEITDEDSRRLFDTNFWGVVNGSRAALEKMRARGGALINVGSTLSDRAIPLQGMYCASKHAVKGFTEALRMEIEADDLPISVTLIKPAAIDTPYKDHAKNYLNVQPENPPPVYSPETVAHAIMHAAEHQVRDIFVGAGAKAISLLGEVVPRITDRLMEATMVDLQTTDEPSNGRDKEGLYKSNDSSLSERGGYPGHVAESSFYTRASLHPVATGTVAALAIGGVAYALVKVTGVGSPGASRDVSKN